MEVGEIVVYWDDAQSSVEYYVKSYIFSGWFYENLRGITGNNLANTQYSVADVNKAAADSIVLNSDSIKTDFAKDMIRSFEGDTSTPFSPSNESTGFENNPESEESLFYEHKRDVIKNSITYNLILSMLVYSEESGTIEYNMPVLSEPEWDTILNNVSITAFMQGMKCGLKFYNNYAIVTSTNNEISVTDNEIYYVPRVIEEIDEDGDGVVDVGVLANLEDHDYDVKIETAHRIDCEKLELGQDTNFQGDTWLGCISFKSKEIKYDKILNKDGSYTYDHKAYTDYNCIVDSNYDAKNRDDSEINGNTDIVDYLIRNYDSSKGLHDKFNAKLKAYRIAIAKERNNLYKTTSFADNYGYQIINDESSSTSNTFTVNLNDLTKKKISEILKIEVTINKASTDAAGRYTDTISATYTNGTSDIASYSVPQTLSTTSTSNRTLVFEQDFSGTSDVRGLRLSTPDVNTKFDLLSVKVYYK